eukprot:Amastigsp_a6162_56.p1 type:complete len:266 gc:universal Amastigsp_a6162_56:373-1170(+)
MCGCVAVSWDAHLDVFFVPCTAPHQPHRHCRGHRRQQKRSGGRAQDRHRKGRGARKRPACVDERRVRHFHGDKRKDKTQSGGALHAHRRGACARSASAAKDEENVRASLASEDLTARLGARTRPQQPEAPEVVEQQPEAAAEKPKAADAAAVAEQAPPAEHRHHRRQWQTPPPPTTMPMPMSMSELLRSVARHAPLECSARQPEAAACGPWSCWGSGGAAIGVPRLGRQAPSSSALLTGGPTALAELTLLPRGSKRLSRPKGVVL